MRHLRRGFGLVRAVVGRAVVTMLAIVVATMSLGASAQAAEGYWRFTGYTTTPPQSVHDAADRGMHQMGRTSETRATGAFQPALSGAGTVDLFVKNDNVDRRIYLTTLKFSFTTGVEMRTLTPGQKLRFNGNLVMGGNALSKALPARGNGGVSANNGDYFISMAGAIDQPASSSGDFLVQRGSGSGDTLTLHALGNLGANGGLSATMHINYVWVPGAPPPLTAQPAPGKPNGPAADALGSQLDVNELNGLWIGVWTRRPGTTIFDAVWHSSQYPEVRDVVRLESIEGARIVFKRDGNGGRYYGTFSADRRTISGVASWYSSGMTWSARVGGR